MDDTSPFGERLNVEGPNAVNALAVLGVPSSDDELDALFDRELAAVRAERKAKP